jgi:hypothetical protein
MKAFDKNILLPCVSELDLTLVASRLKHTFDAADPTEGPGTNYPLDPGTKINFPEPIF